MKVFLNGDAREISADTDLVQLLELFEFPTQRIAVEVNKAVVRRNDWNKTVLSESDVVEVIHFVGGG